MRKFSLGAIAKQQAEAASNATTKRSATTVVGGHEHVLRQTVIALAAGATMSEHENPGEATVFVLSGRVRLDAGDDSWEGRDHDLLEVPPQRHSLVALADSTVLLSVAKTLSQRIEELAQFGGQLYGFLQRHEVTALARFTPVPDVAARALGQ